MRFAAMLITFAVVGVSQSPGADKPKRQIELTVRESSLAVGRQMQGTVKYKNPAETGWTIADPAESLSVFVRYQQASSDQRPYGYALGRTTTSTAKGPGGQTITAVVAPNPKPIMIGSEESHEFEVPFERDWTGNLVPGKWKVWIEDQTESLESNHLELSIRFAPDSVDACLGIAVDKDEPLTKRQWHADWLQQIDPDLKLQWPDEKSSDALKISREYEIQRRLKKFADFWKANKNSTAVRDRIAKINTAAGLSEKK